MTVILKDHKLFYASIPKVACTSLKTMFFEVENGVPFKPIKANGKTWHIHEFYHGWLRVSYPEKRLEDLRRVTLVRDPIKRFLSAYGNRVVHHKDAGEVAVSKVRGFRKLTPNPDLDEFIDRFDRYLSIGSIKWHCRPMVDFIGDDKNYFHGLYGMHQMDAFLEDVSNAVGKKMEAGRFQTGGPKFSPDDLTAKQVAKLETFYSADYSAFSQYF